MKFTLKDFDKIRPLLKDDVIVEILTENRFNKTGDEYIHEIMNELKEYLSNILDSYIPKDSISKIKSGVDILESKNDYRYTSGDIFSFEEANLIYNAYNEAYSLTDSKDLKTIYEKFTSYFKHGGGI